MSTAVNLTEKTSDLILDYIKANIAQALAEVRVDRAGDKSASTEVPKTYFNYSPVKGFRLPAVVLVFDEIDFRLDQGQNFINSDMSAVLSVAVEAKDQDELTRKSWRYQDAIYKLMNRATFSEPDLKFTVLVEKARYSNDAVMQSDANTQSNFAKEVAFDLTIKQYQQD